MYDYNNKSNERQVNETVPTWSQNELFPATVDEQGKKASSSHTHTPPIRKPTLRKQTHTVSQNMKNHLLCTGITKAAAGRFKASSWPSYRAGRLADLHCFTGSLNDSYF